MANTVQHRRGNTVSINSHKGPAGEFVYNTDTNRIHSMDGVAFGGHAHALLSDLDGRALTSTTVSAGTGLTGGGSLAANRTIALNSPSIASLAKADTAVQPGSLSAVATSGAYSDLSGRPVAGQFIPSGGAAGQVLAKSSATNFDTAWVTSAAATAVSYAPQTLTTAQQGQAVANIGGGSLAGFRNKIINPLFAINQRGVTGTVTLSAGQYGHDRFKAGASGCTYTFATSNGVTTITITAGTLMQTIEASAFSGALGNYVLSWVGTAQGRINTLAYGPTGRSVNYNSGVNNLNVEWGVGTLSLPQLEREYSTPFSPRHIQQELDLCQRYYEVLSGLGVSGYQIAGNPIAAPVIFKVTKRVAPTISIISNGTATNAQNIGIYGTTELGGELGLNAIATGFAGTSGTIAAADSEL